jgi:hypothetical protein
MSRLNGRGRRRKVVGIGYNDTYEINLLCQQFRQVPSPGTVPFCCELLGYRGVHVGNHNQFMSGCPEGPGMNVAHVARSCNCHAHEFTPFALSGRYHHLNHILSILAAYPHRLLDVCQAEPVGDQPLGRDDAVLNQSDHSIPCSASDNSDALPP